MFLSAEKQTLAEHTEQLAQAELVLSVVVKQHEEYRRQLISNLSEARKRYLNSLKAWHETLKKARLYYFENANLAYTLDMCIVKWRGKNCVFVCAIGSEAAPVEFRYSRRRKCFRRRGEKLHRIVTILRIFDGVKYV